ncbi:hypothetical protein N2152v2_004711 [Parachlorella kessleri]
MVSGEAQQAPVLRPSKRDFSRISFVEFVRGVFNKHPDWPCFKVVPPKGWKPTKKDYDLDGLRIATPIRQHAFGKGGSYMCILEEQRGMTAAEFEKYADHHQAPPKGGRDDECLERAFWSSVTINPPLYGADTPISLFDDQLEYGWNLKDLGCLFKDYKLPKIVGVTTPMTYFGMWKQEGLSSFSGWHKEDVDLNSINYLHFGAPKVWYCVSPKDAAKFDEMTRALFPDLYRRCPAFMRHKDILICPKVLRHHGVNFTQTKQEPGEFVVLNHAAYHSVFNLGFNCAEAVNFALPEWMPVGRDAVSCECDALPDGVHIDMSIFFPELRRDGEEGSSSEEEEGSSSDEEEEEEEEESEADDSEEEQEQEQQPPRKRGRPRKQPQALSGGRGRKAAASSAAVSRSRGEQQQQQQRLSRAQQAGPGGAKRNRSLSSGRSSPSSSSEGGEGRERENKPANKRHRAAAGSSAKPLRTPLVPQVPTSAKPSNTPKGAAHNQWGPVAMDKPMALVRRDEVTRALSFALVHRLAKPASKPGAVWVGLLTEGPDGHYRPTSLSKQVALGVQYPKLVSVRAEWVEGEARHKGGWKLTTKPSRILM